MDNTVITIIALILASGFGYAIMTVAFKKSADNVKAAEDLASQRGWNFEYIPAHGHDGNRKIISDPDNNWTLTVYFNSTSHSSSTIRWTEWHSHDGALQEGAAVLGPPLPAKTVKLLNGPASGMFAEMIKNLMFQFTKGMDVTLSEMQMVESTAGLPTGTVLATKGQEDAVEIFRDSAALAKARLGKNEMTQPIVFRDTNGIRVRVRTNLKSPEEIVAFIDTACEIKTRLSLLD